MEKIFVTGGSGTVGSSFIEYNYDHYQFMSYSRNEKMQVALKRKFPKIDISMGSVEDAVDLKSAIRNFAPDKILHCAALKHVETSELNPSVAVKANIQGSLNVIEAAIENNVRHTIGISTDKACQPNNAYGYTKALMENMFLKAYSERNKFSVTRFGNVAFSHGSVLPFWLGLASENRPLPLTDKRMNRLMFSQKEAADIIREAFVKLDTSKEPFIISKLMKKVNMYEMAKVISDNIEEVGFRPGEILDETLISRAEVERTEVDGDFIFIYDKLTQPEKRLKMEYNSQNAESMTKDEMQYLLATVNDSLGQSAWDEKFY